MAEYNDTDYTDLALFLDEKYEKDLQRAGEKTFTDATGRGRWTHDYIRERDKGVSHDGALRIVNERINQIVGLPPGTSPRPFPIVTSDMEGKLRCDVDKGWMDANGPYTPIFCHFGEAFSLWVRDPEKIKGALQTIKDAGYDGIRFWITLNVGTNPIPFWHGREVSPIKTPGYYEKLKEFILYCWETHKLRVHIANGDLSGFTNTQENDLFDNLTNILSQIPSEAIALVEALNECRDTGDDDDKTPEELERLINRIRTKQPEHLYALSSFTGTEERDILKAFTKSWMNFFYVHGYRDGEYYDKIRHIFSLTYENPVRKFAWQGEPCGPGRWVSATENKEDLNDYTLAMMACMSLMTGQLWCYMSSPGVIYDQPFTDMPGFLSVPKIKTILPRDIATFTNRFHGGLSSGNKRIFAVPGNDETRADHVLHADGRFCVLMYGPRWREVRQVKDCEIIKEVEFGHYGKLVIGKV